MSDVSFMDEGLLSGAKPREMWLVDYPYRDRETGRLKHAVYVFKTRASAAAAAESLRKYLQEGDQEPTVMRSAVAWEETAS